MNTVIQKFVLAAVVAVIGIPSHALGNEPGKIEGWGQMVDPAGNCRVAESKGRLTITVPGTYHDLTPEPGYENLDAPRVMQEVEGDFVMQVLVRKFDRPLPDTAANPKKPHSFVSSGLLVWQDDGKFIRLDRAASGGSNFLGALSSCFSGETKIASGRSDLRDEDTWLRVERKDGKLSLFQSTGKTWSAIVSQGQDLTLQGKVKVGVFTINATNREITHQFEGFTLTPAPAGN